MAARFKWNDDNFYRLRSDPKIIAALEDMGGQVTQAANAMLGEDGYEMSSQQGARAPFGRWQVRVYTRTGHAKNAEAAYGFLDTALFGGVL